MLKNLDPQFWRDLRTLGTIAAQGIALAAGLWAALVVAGSV